MTLLIVWSIVSVAIAGVLLANLRVRIVYRKTKPPKKVKPPEAKHKKIDIIV